MFDKSSESNSRRLIGRVKWWACSPSNERQATQNTSKNITIVRPGSAVGSQSKKKSGFGVIVRPLFVWEIEKGGDLAQEIFAHKSGLKCEQSDLTEHRWVSFLLKLDTKRPEAIDVKLIEEDINYQTVNDFLALEELDEHVDDLTKLTIFSKIPIQEDHSLLPLLQKNLPAITVEQFDWPKRWMELPPSSPLFEILPKAVKQKRFKNEVNLDTLRNPVVSVVRKSEIFLMSSEDKQLANFWARNDSSYEEIKMLSARHAELKIAEFFSERGISVKDVARHQLSGCTDLWKTYDLLIDSMPVDVKNARKTVNGRTFVEYTVKTFKNDAFNQEVQIAGVLSPYLAEKTVKEETDAGHHVTILGTTTETKIRALENEFSKRELSIDFGDKNRWPVWIFNNELDWFSFQQDALGSFNRFAEAMGEDDWNWCRDNLTPAFMISGRPLPKHQMDKLLPWQQWYLNKLTEKAKSGGLTLPWLYLFTFSHFIEAIVNMPSAEEQMYSPDGYNSLLFYSSVDTKRRLKKHLDKDGWKIRVNLPVDRTRPGSLIDPLMIIDQLIFTLSLLWLRRKSTNLDSLRKFILKGEGLLRAKNAAGFNVTVLAFCGGRIDGKKKCGNSPLVIGVHKTCPNCHMLVCDKCGHCNDRCENQH